ncbi:MAG: hypothetical protein ACI81T_003032 [Bacteroidia bacterium]|jgi:hypothetical protein
MEKRNSSIFNFSKFILAIVTIVFATGLIFNHLFEKYVIYGGTISGASKVNRIINETHPDEIPIFGSSRAQGGYIPSILSKNHFNYGIDGIQANIWLFFLEKELLKDKKTDIIINFDLRGLVYGDGNEINYIPNYMEVKSVLEQSQNSHWLYKIPFFKYFGYYEKYTKYILNEKTNLTKVTDSGGSFEKNELTKQKFDQLVETRLNTTAKFHIEKELEKKLESLMKSTDRKILFVVAPYHSSCLNRFENVEEVSQYLKNLNKIKNVTVFDFGNFLDKDHLFMNTTHVNYNGAKVFSEQLKSIISDRNYRNNGYNIK